MIEIPQLLTIGEAARALGMRESTLRDWRIDRKNIAFVKVGDAIRVDAREIERFIAAHTEPPVAKTVATVAQGGVRDDQPKRAKTIEFPA